jgi:hypothetical protein
MKWLTVTNILKGLKMKVLWESWSMQSSSYNEYNNNKIWRGIKNIKFDLNYLINIINRETTEKIEYLSIYKEFKPLQYNYNPVYTNDYRVSNIILLMTSNRPEPQLSNRVQEQERQQP